MKGNTAPLRWRNLVDTDLTKSPVMTWTDHYSLDLMDSGTSALVSLQTLHKLPLIGEETQPKWRTVYKMGAVQVSR